MQPAFFDSDEVNLFRQDGLPIAAKSALKGVKNVLVYFAAQWCPHSCAFTQRLKGFYEHHHTSESFEVIFVSLDSSEADMRTHFERDHGAYYRLGFSAAQALTAEWGSLYNIHSIPSLLVFEHATPRRLMVRDARRILTLDPDAKFFPWSTYEYPRMRPAHL